MKNPVRRIALLSMLFSATMVSSVKAQAPATEPVAAAKASLAIGKTAQDFRLPAVAGELSGNVQMSDVNAKGPVVIAVLRGFPGSQCPACSAQVADFVKHAEQFAAKGARVLMIYPGAKVQLGQRADEFLQGTQLPAPLTLLLDPDYEFTNAYGLRWDAPQETAYPSTIVVDQAGKISYVKISETHRGRAAAEAVLAAL